MRLPEPLVIATGNPHKVSELRAIFAEAGISVVGLADLPQHARLVEPIEHGDTFRANVRIKARSYASQTGRVCLADDSGIEIDALGGKPGVISSHYATDGVETGITREQRDEANRQRVLRDLKDVPLEQRAARFVCCNCVASPDGTLIAESRGVFEGRIGIPPRVPAGAHGFGYDPLFLLGPDFLQTASELAPSLKNTVSHRSRAAREIAKLLHEA